MNQSELRREAYNYILQLMRKVPAASTIDPSTLISLDDLILLKEGTADPSPALVEGIKQMFLGAIPETDIDAHMVEPFKNK